LIFYEILSFYLFVHNRLLFMAETDFIFY